MRVALVLGTRPQIIKSAPVINEASNHSELELLIIHTGQHYDYELSKIFFEELSLPNPTVNLEVGSGSHAWQVGEMMIRLEKAMKELRPDLVIVPGDTNSTLAGALTSAKLNLTVAHIEAGARSYDMNMPEEINRRLTDHCSNILFAPTENCVNNLRKESVLGKVHLVGDTMYDAFLRCMQKADKNDILEKLNLENESYAVLTIHRTENVDNALRLRSILEAILTLKEIRFIFPIHPRTKAALISTDLYQKIEKSNNVRLLPPMSYYEMLKLQAHAKFIATDSGGIQKEAFWLKTPCITLRDTTEWVETLDLGANVLAGANKTSILENSRKMLRKDKHRIAFEVNPYGDGRASERIINIICQKGQNQATKSQPKI